MKRPAMSRSRVRREANVPLGSMSLRCMSWQVLSWHFPAPNSYAHTRRVGSTLVLLSNATDLNGSRSSLWMVSRTVDCAVDVVIKEEAWRPSSGIMGEEEEREEIELREG